jgi:hypothetical protein
MDSKRKKIKYKNSIKLEIVIDLNQEQDHRLNYSNSSIWKGTLSLISIKHLKEMQLVKFNLFSNNSINTLTIWINIIKGLLLMFLNSKIIIMNPFRT